MASSGMRTFSWTILPRKPQPAPAAHDGLVVPRPVRLHEQLQPPVAVPLDVVPERGAELPGARARPVAPVEELHLERPEEPLGPGVVAAPAGLGHRAGDAAPRADPLPARRPVGAAAVGVDDGRRAPGQGVEVGLERSVAQRRVRVRRQPPGGRQAVVAVDHGAQVVLAAGRGELGDVGHGELAGGARGEVVAAARGALPRDVGGPPVGLPGVGAVAAAARPGRDEPLLAHHAPDPLLGDPRAAQAQQGVDAPVAVAAAALLEGLADGAPERGVAVLPEPGPLVLIGALRDPQESGDLSEGQAGLPPQSLAELCLPPVRDRTGGAAFPF